MTTKRDGEDVDGENPNKKAMTADAKPMERVLIFGGKTGWIGQLMADLVKKEGKGMLVTIFHCFIGRHSWLSQF